jgi:hypothetical protein
MTYQGDGPVSSKRWEAVRRRGKYACPRAEEHQGGQGEWATPQAVKEAEALLDGAFDLWFTASAA